MFIAWKDFPPTNLLVKGLLEGLGGRRQSSAESQGAVLSEIRKNADPRVLPIVRNDPALMHMKPTFDLVKLREKNRTTAITLVKRNRNG